MEIKNSLEWAGVDTAMRSMIFGFSSPRNRLTATLMLRNIQPLVTQLSAHELKVRRSPASYLLREEAASRKKVNDAINDLEQWITILLLSSG